MANLFEGLKAILIKGIELHNKDGALETIERISNMIQDRLPKDWLEYFESMFDELDNMTTLNRVEKPTYDIEKVANDYKESQDKDKYNSNFGTTGNEFQPPLSKDPKTLLQLTNPINDKETKVVKKPTSTNRSREIQIEDVSSDVIIPKETTSGGRALFPSGSPQQLNSEEIQKRITASRIWHATITSVMSIISIIVEVSTVGQIDKIIENLLVIYNLFPSSTIYNSAQGIDIEIETMRPYRFLVESANQTNIPPMTDLITFLVREQLGETAEEGMTVFKRFASMYGFSDFWANAYWNSHWILPQTQELYAMFGRGIIDETTLRKQLIINDIKPEWVDKVMELSHNLPNRVEARQMQRTKKMSSEQLDKIISNARIDSEYSEDYKFWLENQELDTLNIQEVKQYRDMYVKGYISKNDYEKILETSIYSEAERIKMMNIDELKIIEKVNDNRLATLKLLRRKNTLDQTEAINQGQKIIVDKRLLESVIELEEARIGLLVELELGTFEGVNDNDTE